MWIGRLGFYVRLSLWWDDFGDRRQYSLLAVNLSTTRQAYALSIIVGLLNLTFVWVKPGFWRPKEV